jgi:uncharacterized protein (DUF1501 family)
MPMMQLTRRSALLGLTSAWMLGRSSLAFADAATDKRFVVVILRGALDGLAAVVPYGDRNLAGWRGGLIPGAVGTPGGMYDLGGFFGLHPALGGLHDMYAAGEMLPVHAVAGPYRSRSHFDAQDYLESGTDHRLTSGWLNRVVSALPASPSPAVEALAIGVSIPLLLRGPATVENWAPESFQSPPPDLYARIAMINAGDPLTGPLIREGYAERGFAQSALGEAGMETQSNSFATLAGAAGRMMAATNGPRIVALEAGGWDTHAKQVALLAPPLRYLDQGLVALKQGLGPAWKDTAVLVMTEFGRTVRMNGTLGTDHGTATAAFVLGGAVAGGRVGGTWPGLRQGQLFENRDLAPTADLRAVALGLLADHLGLPPARFGEVFPGSTGVNPMSGLIRA